ncbi:MAG TPA: CpsD/CapB family tyrosine-protein kinase [Candidatus Manganitrophaceae bacterium]|nr:CpsD/CapB family tyrosine-protein kinase [Candidatus Manganitrophaceae bacterium]
MFGKSKNGFHMDDHLVTLTDPKSIAAEQYRVLRSRIEHLSLDKGFRTFVITSPVVGEGKSTTAANLALSMAHSKDKRVVLVDCDLRRPTLHTLLGIKMKEGVVDILEEKATLSSALTPIHDPTLANPLYFLPAGRTHSLSPEWLSSAKMENLIAALSQQFDFVFFDTPPILPLADSAVLGGRVDGSLLVIRAGKTSLEVLTMAMESIDLQNWVGVILNGVDFVSSSRYGSVYAMYQKTYYGQGVKG